VETAEPGFSTWQGEEISISSKHSDWLWDLSNFVYNGYTGGGGGFFLRGKHDNTTLLVGRI